MNEQDITITEGSGNVFIDLGFDSDEAEVMKLRAELMIRTAQRFKEKAGRSCAPSWDSASQLITGKVKDICC